MDTQYATSCAVDESCARSEPDDGSLLSTFIRAWTLLTTAAAAQPQLLTRSTKPRFLRASDGRFAARRIIRPVEEDSGYHHYERNDVPNFRVFQRESSIRSARSAPSPVLVWRFVADDVVVLIGIWRVAHTRARSKFEYLNSKIILLLPNDAHGVRRRNAFLWSSTGKTDTRLQSLAWRGSTRGNGAPFHLKIF